MEASASVMVKGEVAITPEEGLPLQGDDQGRLPVRYRWQELRPHIRRPEMIPGGICGRFWQ